MCGVCFHTVMGYDGFVWTSLWTQHVKGWGLCVFSISNCFISIIIIYFSISLKIMCLLFPKRLVLSLCCSLFEFPLMSFLLVWQHANMWCGGGEHLLFTQWSRLSGAILKSYGHIHLISQIRVTLRAVFAPASAKTIRVRQYTSVQLLYTFNKFAANWFTGTLFTCWQFQTNQEQI